MGSNLLSAVGSLGNPMGDLLNGLLGSRGISPNSGLAQMSALNAQLAAMDDMTSRMRVVHVVHESLPYVPTKHQARCAYCTTKQTADAIRCDSCGAPQ